MNLHRVLGVFVTLCVLSLIPACQTDRDRNWKYELVEEYNIRSLFKEKQAIEIEREAWRHRVGPISRELRCEADRIRNQVYSDEAYVHDAKAFLDALLHRINAINAEVQFYRNWFFRLEDFRESKGEP